MAEIIRLGASKTKAFLKKHHNGKDVRVSPVRCECRGFMEVWRWRGSEHERVLLEDLRKEFTTIPQLVNYLKSLPLVKI